MTRSLCAMTLAFAVSIGAGLPASDALKAVVGSYLDIQAQLAADKIDAVKPAAQAIARQAARMGSGGEAIVKASKAIEQAADLNAARAAFGDLSDAVIAEGTAEGWKDVPDIRIAYCPMVKKSWVQKEETVRNPYYGTAMLTCGAFRTK